MLSGTPKAPGGRRVAAILVAVTTGGGPVGHDTGLPGRLVHYGFTPFGATVKTSKLRTMLFGVHDTSSDRLAGPDGPGPQGGRRALL